MAGESVMLHIRIPKHLHAGMVRVVGRRQGVTLSSEIILAIEKHVSPEGQIALAIANIASALEELGWTPPATPVLACFEKVEASLAAVVEQNEKLRKTLNGL